MITLAKFQIGKNGVTDGVLQSLELALKHHKQVRVSVLKSATRDKEKLREMASEIQKKLNVYCDFKIIGYTIIFIKRTTRKVRK